MIIVRLVHLNDTGSCQHELPPWWWATEEAGWAGVHRPVHGQPHLEAAFEVETNQSHALKGSFTDGAIHGQAWPVRGQYELVSAHSKPVHEQSNLQDRASEGAAPRP